MLEFITNTTFPIEPRLPERRNPDSTPEIEYMPRVQP